MRIIINRWLIKGSLTDQISYYHIALLLATLPFDQFYGHVVLISFALHTLVHLKKERIKRLISFKTLLLQAVFFNTLISCFYTPYRNLALTDVTRQLEILLLPTVFALSSFDLYKHRDRLLQLYTFVCAATVGYLYLHAFRLIHFFKLPFRSIISAAFISHNFSEPIQMHATFFSLQLTIAFFYAVIQLCKIQRPKVKLLYNMAVLLLFAGTIQLGSKAVLAVMLVGINVLVPWFLLVKAKRLHYMAITIPLTIIIMAVALNAGSLRARYLTDLKTDLSVAKANELSDPRLARWGAALQCIARKPVAGYGAGSELKVLNDEFFVEKLYNSYLNHLNAHNQYLSCLITTGIIGLIFYMATLLLGFRLAFAHKDMLFFAFILLITVVSFSESLLNAEKGVSFFSLFLCFFIYSVRTGFDKYLK
jgi:O-antigen ligase